MAFCCFWSNTLELTPIVCSWSITDTDSVLCASEDCVILQSIRNTNIAPTLQFRLYCCANINSLTYLLTNIWNRVDKVLQQEAYPAVWPLLTPKTWPSLGLSPPKWEKKCLRCGRTAVQNFTPIGKAPAEKFVTVQKVTVNLMSHPYYRMAR